MKSSYFENYVVQTFVQIHGASAAFVSMKILLYTGKYHNIHFFSDFSFFSLMILQAFTFNQEC